LNFSRVPVVTRDEVKYAKPDPDLFLAAAERLRSDADVITVVGDSVWDMLAATRARFLASA
jgi:HAD superfamily hydrolase (TIGR01549 family)